MKRSKTGLLIGGVMGAVFVLGTLLGTRVAFSGKVTDSGGGTPVNTGPSPMPAPAGCDNGPSFDLAQKLVSQVIENKKWTQKDHEKIAPLFYGLHTDQKVEILKKVGVALDSRKLVVEKGARLF
jgi:hypothetical protein